MRLSLASLFLAPVLLMGQAGQFGVLPPVAGGASGGPPTGAAGGGLTGTYPNPGIAGPIFPLASITNANFVFYGDSRTCGTGATAGVCGVTPYTIPASGFVATTTGTASVGSTALTVASGTGTVNGQAVFGVGIAPETTVSSGGGTTSIVLSVATVAALSTTAVSFGNMDYPSQAMRLPAFSGHGTGYNAGFSGLTCSQLAGQYTVSGGPHALSPAVTGKPGYLFVNCGTNGEGTVTPTATGTSGVASIVVSVAAGIDAGMSVSGTGIGASAKVATSYTGGTTIPLTVNNSGTVSGTMTFTTSAAVIAAATANLWALGAADGYIVIATTNPDHVNTSAFRNMNDAYNNLIRGAFGSWTYIMDLQATLVDTYDPSYFYTDFTHFTNEAYGIFAGAAAEALVTPGVSHFGMVQRRYANIGTGSSNTRYPDTCAYAMTTGGSNSCFGYGSLPSLTTGNFNSSFGDTNAPSLTTGAANLIIGHGVAANLVTGGSNVLVGGDTSTDSSFGVSLGIGCSVTGGSGICIGHNATAAGSAFALGGGATASASGAVEIDPVNAGTNSTANTLQFQTFNFLTSSGLGKFAGIASEGTKFTTSGCSVSATVGGATAGTYTSGTSGTCTVTITMNGATGQTAPNGWACYAQDVTTPADAQTQTTTTATAAVISGTTVSGDIVRFHCLGY